MRKTTKLLLTLALIVMGAVGAQATKKYADLSKASNILGNAKWNYETRTLSWDSKSNNLMDLPDLVGDWSEYTTIKLETSDLQGGGQFRLMVYFDGTPETITMYSAGNKDLKFSERFAGKDLSKVTQVRLGGSGSETGSVVISKVYLDGKPMSLSFDETGVAEIDVTDLSANGCFSLDDETGVLTSVSTTEWGQLKVNLPTEGVDLSNVTKLEFNFVGETPDMINTLEIKDAVNGTLGTFYSSKYVLDFSSYADKASQVTSIMWSAPYQSTKDATMTIKSIKLTADVMTVVTAGETLLNTLQYHKFSDGSNATAAWNVGKSTDTYYGSGSSDANYYVDLTDYAELRIYRDDNTGFRAFFINAAGTGTNNINNSSSCVTWVDSDKYFAIDLTQVEKYDGKVYLNTIKSSSYGTNNIVNNIVAYNAPATNAPKYIISGSGVLTASVQAALADVAATAIDATGVTKAVELPTANPNCLIVAQEGMVTNGQNVIVDGTCANLVLTDGYAFAAPVGFTATEAKYGTTINASAGVGTLVLPFDAELPSGVTAFTLSYTSGASEATATEIEKLTANTPVLLNGSGEAEFMAAGVSIAVTADEAVKAGALNGVYAATEISTGYVLQNGSQGAGFYKVNAEKPIEVKPFRAYLTADGGAARIAIVYDSESTGISSMYNEQCTMNEEVYDLQGRRMVREARGVYVKNGKKYVVK